MTIAFTSSNILQLFSAISPLLLGFFLVMSSLFNLNLKGLVYLAGVLLASAVNLLVMAIIKNPKSPNRNFACNMIEYPTIVSLYDSPSISSVFIAFTTAYLLLPMKFNEQINYPVLASLLFLLGMDGYNKVRLFCTPISGVIFGSLSYSVLSGILFSTKTATTRCFTSMNSRVIKSCALGRLTRPSNALCIRTANWYPAT
jgi:hypothetical protein